MNHKQTSAKLRLISYEQKKLLSSLQENPANIRTNYSIDTNNKITQPEMAVMMNSELQEDFLQGELVVSPSLGRRGGIATG